VSMHRLRLLLVVRPRLAGRKTPHL
jgi:hypothetical protein